MRWRRPARTTSTPDEGRRVREVRRARGSRIHGPAKVRSGRRRDPDQGACHDGDGSRVSNAARPAAVGSAHPRCSAAPGATTQAGPGAGRRSGVRRKGCEPVRARVKVFGFTGFGWGANAEYICMAQSGVGGDHAVQRRFRRTPRGRWRRREPSTALYFLRDKAHVRPGQRVLINGAAGSIGTYAVQLARHFGADVTAVCSARNTELGAIPWRGPCHRLHRGGFHPTTRPLRRHLRHDRRQLVRTVPRRAHSGRPLLVDDGIGQLATHVVDRGSRRPKGHHRYVRRQA